MAVNNKKDQFKNEKDKHRRKYRVLRELRFWLAGFLLVSIVITVCVGVSDFGKRDRLYGMTIDGVNDKTVAVSTGKTGVSLEAMSFFFYDGLYDIMESDTFIRDYRAYGLDPTKPLRSLEYTTLRSWFEQLMDETCTMVETTVRYGETARKAGLKLEAEDEEKIEEHISKLKERAKEEKRAFGDYLDYRYGTGLTEKDVRTALNLYYLAQKQYNITLDELQKCTDDELSDYYYEHRGELDTLDFITYRFEIKNRDEANAKLSTFKACKSDKEFLALIKEDLPKEGCPEEQVDRVLADCQQRLKYGTESDFASWAFENDRAKGDILTREANGYYEVYYIVRPGGKYTFPSANVRALYISSEVYTDPAKLKEVAEGYYNQALANGTEEYFEELVKEHSHDFNTAYYGGKYVDIVPGDLGENYNDWVFAEDRKAGDIGIVEGDGGYNVFYYIGDGDECWKVSAKNALVDERISAFTEELESSMEVKLNQVAVYQEIPDNLATNHKRDYTVSGEGDKLEYAIHSTVLLGFFCCLALSVILLGVTIWSFIEVYRLKKRYGYTK